MIATSTSAADWQLVMPKGEFEIVDDAGRKRVQVFDDAALFAVAENFKSKVLVDYDHNSYDPAQSSEAAGWIGAVENRADGLWGAIEWSDRGEHAVNAQRYRFLSPAFRPSDVQPLDGNRVRPLRLDTVALTNKPNISAMPPLLNRASGRGQMFGGRSGVRPAFVANRGIPSALRNRSAFISGADFINEIRRTRGGSWEEAWEDTRFLLNRFTDRGHALLNNLWHEATANEQAAYDRTWDSIERSEPLDRGARKWKRQNQPTHVFTAAIRELMAKEGLSFDQAWERLRETEPVFWLRHVFAVTQPNVGIEGF